MLLPLLSIGSAIVLPAQESASASWMTVAQHRSLRPLEGLGSHALSKMGCDIVPVVGQFSGVDLLPEPSHAFTARIISRAMPDRSIEIQGHFVRKFIGDPASATAIAFRFTDWTTRNGVFIPAACYAGNRFRCLPVDYPPVFPPSEQVKNPPVTITDVPRLNLESGPSKMELLSSSASCPAVGVFMPDRRKGMIVLFPDRTEVGQTGITVEESDDRKSAVIVISTPGVRSQRYGFMHLGKSEDKAHDWSGNPEWNFSCRVLMFDALKPTDLYAKFLKVRKTLTGRSDHRDITPYSAALESEIQLQNRERWYSKGEYFKNGNGDSPFGHIQLGWVGGLMSTYPMIVQRKEPGFSRSLLDIDTTLSKLQGRSGLLYGIYKNGVKYGDNFAENEHKPEIAMVRKNGDGLYYLLKQLRLLKLNEVKPAWKVAARRWSESLARLWEKNHQFGQLVNVQTREISVGGSTAGAIIPAALTLASETFHDPRYLRIGEESLQMMVERDLAKGYTTGGPGEILQCPDSESAFALLESTVVVYEATQNPKVLEWAKQAAALCSTWVVSYDFPFPPSSELGKVEAHSTGAVWASIQNKHAAPGICSASGDCLLKLYRYTGDPIYMDLLQDIGHNLLEFVSRKDRPIGARKDGYVNERVNLSDWEGNGSVGAVGDSSVSWCELAVMLTCTDLPGVYADTTTRRIWCFDHVRAKWLGENRLQLTNDTKLSAHVSLLVESTDNRQSRLSEAVTQKVQWVDLLPGESKEIQVHY